MFLQAEAHWIPACHDVEGDDTAQRVRDDGHFPTTCLKLRVTGAEERVQTIQLLC